MSKPCKFDKDSPVQSVVGEIIDAMSALNMEPCPIKPDCADDVYLSEVDAWAKHAMEHLHQAVAHTRELDKYIRQLKEENYQMKARLSEARQEIKKLVNKQEG